MPPLSLLIKPASSACNMTCAYCFYRDVASHRQEGFQGMLSPRLMEEVVAGAMEFAEHSCSFLFQGGEPTLAGLDFYRRLGFERISEEYTIASVPHVNMLFRG